MSGTCAKCELPTSNGRRLCRDCSREEYFDGMPAQVDVEPDHTPGRYGVPRSAASYLLDRIQVTPWNPDAELRLMIGDLRGDWPEEWMLQDQAGFQSARQIRADGGRSTSEDETEQDPLEAYEAKMDELNDGLLEAYAAGFAKAIETYDINGPSDKSVAGLKRKQPIREFHHYYWHGRSKPLEFWLRDQFGLDDDRDDEPGTQQEDDDLRADGSGFGTLVDRDGNPIEPRPDLAGEHRDTTRSPKGKSRINGHQLNSKWSEVRQAVIDADEDLPTSEVADRADVSTSAARNWLGKAHDAGYIRPTRTITRPRNEFDEWAIADVGADDLPEVLLSE